MKSTIFDALRECQTRSIMVNVAADGMTRIIDDYDELNSECKKNNFLGWISPIEGDTQDTYEEMVSDGSATVQFEFQCINQPCTLCDIIKSVFEELNVLIKLYQDSFTIVLSLTDLPAEQQYWFGGTMQQKNDSDSEDSYETDDGSDDEEYDDDEYDDEYDRDEYSDSDIDEIIENHNPRSDGSISSRSTYSGHRGTSSRSTQSLRSERTAQSDISRRSSQSNRSQASSKSENSVHSNRSLRSQKSTQSNRSVKSDNSTQSNKSRTSEKSRISNKSDRSAKSEKSVQSDRSEKLSQLKQDEPDYSCTDASINTFNNEDVDMDLVCVKTDSQPEPDVEPYGTNLPTPRDSEVEIVSCTTEAEIIPSEDESSTESEDDLDDLCASLV